MGNNFKAVIKTSIRFDVDMFLPTICNIFKIPCIFAILTTAVYFKLYAKISFTFAIENWLRFVAVVLDFVIVINVIIAAAAIWQVIILAYIVLVNDSVAAFTSAVMVVKAFSAKICVVVCYAVLCPERFTAVVAGNAVVVYTFVTKQLVFNWCSLVFCKSSSAEITGSFFFHFGFLHKQKFR